MTYPRTNSIWSVLPYCLLLLGCAHDRQEPGNLVGAKYVSKESPRDYFSTDLAVEIHYEVLPIPDDLVESYRSIISSVTGHSVTITAQAKINCINCIPDTDDLSILESYYRSRNTIPDVITLHIFWLTSSTKQDTLFGLTYGPSSVAVFNINYMSEQEQLNALIHETGHVFGLVGYRSPTNGNHNQNNHCVHSDCTMYYMINGITHYCADCLADLKLLRN